MNKIIVASIIIFSQLSSSIIYSQALIKGKVVDKMTREPLELAVVTNERTLKNVVTDKDGNFVLRNAAAEDSLTISFIGYRSQKTIIEPSGNADDFARKRPDGSERSSHYQPF